VSDFPVNPHRSDPYGAFRFRVIWEGRVVAGVSKVSALTRTTEAIEHRAGGEPGTPHRIPGLTRFAPVTLERGLTHDTAFEEWAGQVFTVGRGLERDLVNFRKSVVLQLFNAAGQMVMAYRLLRCWPSEYRAVPTLDGDRAAVAIQSLTLEVEGWERDRAVTEPTEPSLSTR
jgi:phage tail-like protein